MEPCHHIENKTKKKMVRKESGITFLRACRSGQQNNKTVQIKMWVPNSTLNANPIEYIG